MSQQPSLHPSNPLDPALYDRDVRQTIPFYETIHQETIDLVQAFSPSAALWLDTGCGTGHLVEAALKDFPQTHFLLADPAPGMLEQARQRLVDAPTGQVEFLGTLPSQGLVAYEGKLRPQVITAILCHHYLPPEQRREAVRACYRLLDAGGLFVAFENIAPDTSEGLRFGLERWKRFQVAQGRSPEKAAEHLKRYGTAYFPIRVQEHLSLLREVGFRMVEILWRAQMQAGFYAVK